MTPYEAYVLYCALKMHFTTDSYDFQKYQGKVRVLVDNFEKRKDKFFFTKLSRRKDAKEFLIANFIASGPNIWIGDLVNSTEAENNLTQWKKRTQALGYLFEEDLKKLLTSLDDNVIIKEHQHPFLLKLFFRKKISLETLVVLNDLLGFFKHWNKELSEDILWKDTHLLCNKYRLFLDYDKKKMRNIALKVFEPV